MPHPTRPTPAILLLLFLLLLIPACTTAAATSPSTIPPLASAPHQLFDPLDSNLPANAALLSRLEEPLSTPFEAKETPLNTLMESFASQTKLPLDIEWAAIEAANFPANTVVTVNLKNMSNRQALSSLLRQVSSGQPSPLAYIVRDGRILISATEEIQSFQYTCVYDISDLISSASPASLYLGLTTNQEEKPDSNWRAAYVLSAITDLVDADNPRDPDAPTTNLPTILNGRLLVHTTPATQTQITTLLQNLRHPTH